MSPVWKWFFWAEIPLMSLTVLYWLILPYNYLRVVLSVKKPNKAMHLLLALYACITATVTAYYAYLLAYVALNSMPFLVWQIVLCVGDVLIVVASLVYMVTIPMNYFLLGQVIMATLWGTFRMVFLPINWQSA